MEARGASLEELLPLISGESSRKAGLGGDFEAGQVLAGEAVGLIHDIPTVQELFDNIVSEAKSVSQQLDKIGVGR